MCLTPRCFPSSPRGLEVSRGCCSAPALPGPAQSALLQLQLSMSCRPVLSLTRGVFTSSCGPNQSGGSRHPTSASYQLGRLGHIPQVLCAQASSSDPGEGRGEGESPAPVTALAGPKHVVEKVPLPSRCLTASTRGLPVGVLPWGQEGNPNYASPVPPLLTRIKSSSDANRVGLGWFLWGGRPSQKSCPEKRGARETSLHVCPVTFPLLLLRVGKLKAQAGLPFFPFVTDPEPSGI